MRMVVCTLLAVVLFQYASCSSLFDSALEHADWIRDVRRQFHMYPELGMEEVKTGEIIRKHLTDMGISFEYPVATTGIVASIGSGKPVVGLRADMDALKIDEPEGLAFRSQHEGAMHACGHDGHMAMLLGAAKLLKARENDLGGTVKLIFQPGEEGFAGGKQMVEAGVMKSVDAVFAFHNMPFLDLGLVGGRKKTIMAGSASFHITFHGLGGHAAQPHMNIDPIPAAAQFVSAVQALSSRETDPLDSVVVSVTVFHAGRVHNVIPDTAQLEGTVRALAIRTFERTIERVEAMAAAIGGVYRCNVTVAWDAIPIYPPTVNDGAAWDFASRVASGLFGQDKVVEVDPIMPAEDFSFFTQQAPGAMIFLGNWERSAGPTAALHNPMYKLHEGILARGAALHAALASEFLRNGTLSASPPSSHSPRADEL